MNEKNLVSWAIEKLGLTVRKFQSTKLENMTESSNDLNSKALHFVLNFIAVFKFLHIHNNIYISKKDFKGLY